MSKLQSGEKAPNFTLPDQNFSPHSLSDYLGKWVLLYFYPKDNTPGCTVEACGMRDNLPKFEKLNAVVFGISADSAQSHKKFENNHKLNFTLLADMEKTVALDYGVWVKKKFMGREYLGINRTSFLIDPQGKIKKIYEKVKPFGHAEEVLVDIIKN